MSTRSSHPQVVMWSCRVYRLLMWLYPASLRRHYKDEMLLTFRNQVEDVVNDGRPSSAMLFAGRMAIDWLRTVALEPHESATFSVLGLGSQEGEACGCVDGATVSVSLMLAYLGVLVLIGGWWWWLHYTATILTHHRSL